jgi:hypothetical protein
MQEFLRMVSEQVKALAAGEAEENKLRLEFLSARGALKAVKAQLDAEPHLRYMFAHQIREEEAQKKVEDLRQALADAEQRRTGIVIEAAHATRQAWAWVESRLW